jgi:hypothetical protein
MSSVGDDLAGHNDVTAGKRFISLTSRLWRQRFQLEASQCVIRDVIRQANCYFGSKLVSIGEHADWSPKIYTINRNHSKHSGFQLSIYGALRNEGNPKALFDRRLYCVDLIDLQSKSPVWVFLKYPLFGECSRGRFWLANNEAFFTKLV